MFLSPRRLRGTLRSEYVFRCELRAFSRELDVNESTISIEQGIFKKKNFNVYLFLRERGRENVNRGGTEREGDAESEAGSRL